MDNKNKKQTKKRIDFVSLYPRPKTYDEIEKYHEAVEARRLKRQPKYAPIAASIYLSLSVLVLVLFVSNPSIIFVLGLISGVAAAMLVGIVWAGFTWWQVNRLADFFAQKGYNATPFLAAYFISVIPLLKAGYEWSTPILPVIAVYALLMLINIALINLLAVIVITKKLSNIQKMAALSLVVIVSIALAIVSTLIS